MTILPTKGLCINHCYSNVCLSTAQARKTLAECRQSCREFYKDWAEEDLPEMIKLYGGLEDSVNDLFGFKYDLCDPNMGFTSSGRF